MQNSLLWQMPVPVLGCLCATCYMCLYHCKQLHRDLHGAASDPTESMKHVSTTLKACQLKRTANCAISAALVTLLQACALLNSTGPPVNDLCTHGRRLHTADAASCNRCGDKAPVAGVLAYA